MRSIFLGLVLGAAALGIVAVPSSAEARPAHAYVVNHYHHERHHHHGRYVQRHWWEWHHYWHR
jgi:hypothetical protein